MHTLGMSVSPLSFVQPRQRCAAQQPQQPVEGEIKAAMQLLKRTRANLTDRPPLKRPLAADPSSEGIDQRLGADHHRLGLKDKPLPIKRRFGPAPSRPLTTCPWT